MSRPAVIGMGGKALELASLVPLVTVLPRSLGPSDFGLFALGASIVTISAIGASLGGPTLAARFISSAPVDEQVPLARALVRRSITWRLLLASAVSIAVLVALPGAIPASAWLLVLAALGLDVLATLLLQAALPLGGVASWSLRYPVQNVVLVIAALVFHDSWGRLGALAGLPVASGAALALAVATAWPKLRRSHTAPDLPAGLRRFGAVTAVSGLCQLGLHRGPVVAVALAGATAAEVGFAGIAVGVATGLTYAVWQVYTVELPRLVAAAPEVAERWLRQATRLFLFGLAPVAALGALAAQWVIPGLLGPSFTGAVTPVAVALGLLPLASPIAAVGQVTALRLQPGRRLAAVAVGFLAFVVVGIACVPVWSATGGSVALVAGAAATATMGAVVAEDVVRPSDTAASVFAAASVVALALVA